MPLWRWLATRARAESKNSSFPTTHDIALGFVVHGKGLYLRQVSLLWATRVHVGFHVGTLCKKTDVNSRYLQPPKGRIIHDDLLTTATYFPPLILPLIQASRSCLLPLPCAFCHCCCICLCKTLVFALPAILATVSA